MERRDIEEGVLVNAVPAEENHRTWIFLCRLFQLPDKIRVSRSLDQALHLVLIGDWHIAEPINAFIEVGQRQQIQEDVEWRQDSGRKTVADEIAPQHRQIQSRIAADIVGPANRVEQRDLRKEIGERRKHAQWKQYPTNGVFPHSDGARSPREHFGKRGTHKRYPDRGSTDPNPERALTRIAPLSKDAPPSLRIERSKDAQKEKIWCPLWVKRRHQR